MNRIDYTDDLSGLFPEQFSGFFSGWPSPPNPEKHLFILRKSYKVWLAFDDDRCVGFINALSDSVFYAYIPLLEVLPDYRGTGIGTELVRRMLASLDSMYAVDIVCDPDVVPFYEKLGFTRCAGMIRRKKVR